MGQINRELMRKDAPIGVFDSGVGGLTVAREIMRQIPNEKLYISGITPGSPTAANLRKPLPGTPSRLQDSCAPFR